MKKPLDLMIFGQHFLDSWEENPAQPQLTQIHTTELQYWLHCYVALLFGWHIEHI